MFSISDNNFSKYLFLKDPVSDVYLKDEFIRYFDNDGFELSFLEQEYYIVNNVRINHTLNHYCNQPTWMTLEEDKNLVLDHCMILQRWEFVGEAKQQLEANKLQHPQLNKYLKLKAKWGLDFSLEYYEDDIALEVIHIETDYNNYDEAVAGKEYFEEKFTSTDWHNFTKSILSKKSEWEHLQGMAQNDWKAVHWGLDSAEKTLKAFK